MKSRLLGAALAGAQLFSTGLWAQETPSPQEEIRALKQRLEQLEQRIQELEAKPATPAPASTTSPDAAATQRIQELDQKLRVLERNRELEQEAADAKAKTAPQLSIGDKGFTFTSADTNFSIALKGLLQVDSRKFFGDSGAVGNDGIILRRARPIIAGTVFKDFDFLFAPDFGGSSTPQITDAYLNYRYSPELQFRAGKFKTPVGLEFLQSDQNTLFVERALPTLLVPNRDMGFMLHGDALGGVLSYAAGIFNGVGDGRTSSNVDIDDNKSFAGRLFVQPFRASSVAALQGFGFGVGGSYEGLQRSGASALPNGSGFSTPGQSAAFAYRTNAVATGDHWRISPQAYYYYGPLSILGEYVISDQEVTLTGTGAQPTLALGNTAWQLAAGWVLTGENATFNGVVPRRSFNPRAGTWGALQVVARLSELDIDKSAFPTFADPLTSARSVQEWAVGLNWYLNRNLRISTSFSHINFVGGGSGTASSGPGATTRKDENVLLNRVQLAF